METCVFCKIISGKLPCYKTYENRHFLGFLDINPRSPGHSLLITKQHYRWAYDVPNFGDFFENARVLGLAIKDIVKPKYISFQTFGVIAPHAHIHVVPYITLSEDENQRRAINPKDAAALANKILKQTQSHSS